MNRSFIVPIVEGHGEVEAFPELLRRLFKHYCPEHFPKINPPLRIKSGSFLHDNDYFNRYIELAARKAKEFDNSAVVVLLDCDDGCPKELGPSLLAKVKAVRNDVNIFVSLAHREYETWFIAASESLRGVEGLPNDLSRPDYFQNIRNAKGWLGNNLKNGYIETKHQLIFSRLISVEEASVSPSFARLCRFVDSFGRGVGSSTTLSP